MAFSFFAYPVASPQSRMCIEERTFFESDSYDLACFLKHKENPRLQSVVIRKHEKTQ